MLGFIEAERRFKQFYREFMVLGPRWGPYHWGERGGGGLRTWIADAYRVCIGLYRVYRVICEYIGIDGDVRGYIRMHTDIQGFRV